MFNIANVRKTARGTVEPTPNAAEPKKSLPKVAAAKMMVRT
jgi:hypothetical protein